MKNLFQLQNELTTIEKLSANELVNILGGKRRVRRHKMVSIQAFVPEISFLESAATSEPTNATEDDKRRQRPGGGTTTTSPNSFL